MFRFFVVFAMLLMPTFARAVTCDAGYYLNDGVCIICPAGTYNDVPDAVACKTPDDGYYVSVCLSVEDLPSEYTQMDYIQATGTQWIDTGYKTKANDEIGLTGQHVGSDVIFYGNFWNTSWTYFIVRPSGTHGAMFRGKYNDNFSTKYTIPARTDFTSLNNTNNVKFDGNVIYTYGNPHGQFTGTVSGSVYLFRHGNTNQNGVIKRWWVTRDGARVRDMVPAKRNSDGAVGMYDIVEQKFYANSGTGEFGTGGVCPATEQLVCDAGYYCADGARRVCPTGKYSSDVGAPECVAPDTGYYASGAANGSGATAQTLCEAGYYCVNGVRTACPSGKYNGDVGATECVAADTGYYASGAANGSGATAQTLCEAGYYCVNGVRTACPSGKYNGDVGATECVAVDTGYYVSGAVGASGATTQTQCEPGYYCASGVRKICPSGTYSFVAGATECIQIEDGYYASNGGTDKSLCEAGYYCAGGVRKICPAGTWGNTTGATECTQIQDGFYGTNCEVSSKDGYTQLEYIEGTAAQFIDTLYVPTPRTSVKFGMYAYSNTGSVVVGFFNNDSTDYRVFNYANRILFDYNSNRIEGGTIDLYTYYDIEFGNYYFKINGDVIKTGTVQTENLQERSIGIFADPGGSYPAWARIYYLKIYEGGELVRDFVPMMRNSDGVIGMYEMITDAFFTSANKNGISFGPRITEPIPAVGCHGFTQCTSGDFCAGGIKQRCPVGTYSDTDGATECKSPSDGYYVVGATDGAGATSQTECDAGYYCVDGVRNACPFGTYSNAGATECITIENGYYGTGCMNAFLQDYTQIEYIEGVRNSLIDTKYYPTPNTSFEFGIVFLENSGAVIIGYGGADNADYRLIYVGQIMWDYNTSRLYMSSGGTALNTYYDMKIANNYVVQDGATILSGVKQTSNQNRSIQVLPNYRGQLYYLRIYENDELVRDFVPAKRNADGVVGLYETMAGEFYLPTGAAFVSGENAGACVGMSLCEGGHYCTGGYRNDCGIGVWSDVGASACSDCVNAPENSYYTTPIWPNAQCPWVCNDGLGRTSIDTCAPMCTAGITKLNTSTGVVAPLFATANTVPALHIKNENGTCHADLIPGAGENAIHIRYNGQTYHTMNVNN